MQRARGRGYTNFPDNYNNSSRVITNRAPAPYNVPAGMTVDPRAVVLAAALGTVALPKSVPSTSERVVGREKGRQRTSSNTQNSSVNVPNTPEGGASNFGDSLADAL